MNSVPWLVFSSSMLPECCNKIIFVMERPRPLDPLYPFMNGVKICFFSWSLIDYQEQIHKKGTNIYHIQNKMDILADSEKIRVVFQNLLENQLKYRNSLMAIRAYKKGDTIIMLFYNDGEIISDQLKKQIFTPFMKGYMCVPFL